MLFLTNPTSDIRFRLSRPFLTIRQNSLYVTVCMFARSSYQGYFIHSLSTLYYYNAPSLATRLTGDYRDRTCTGKCDPALLDTLHKKRSYKTPFLQSYSFALDNIKLSFESYHIRINLILVHYFVMDFGSSSIISQYPLAPRPINRIMPVSLI